MGYGIPQIEYDFIICEECGRKMEKITVRHLQTHFLTIPEYKEKWGFYKTQPLECLRIREVRRQKVFENETYKNLDGKKYQFKRGHTNFRYNCEQGRLHLEKISHFKKSEKFKRKQHFISLKRKRNRQGQFS